MPTFFWTKKISRLHCKTFYRLKYYFHAFTEYYNGNIRKNPHQSSNVGIVDGACPPPKCSSKAVF